VARPLDGLPVVTISEASDIDDAVREVRRVIVLGSQNDLAAVLTRLLRSEKLDVEVGFAPRQGRARRARTGVAQRVPLIRDETGAVLAGSAEWSGTDGSALHGEAVVDPTAAMPGLRAAVLTRRGRPRRWVTGRAAQLGTTGAMVVRDGVAAPRPVKRSTFYRHTKGWLAVR